MNKLLISLGSNEDSEINMSLCRKLLSDMFSFIVFSETSITSPYGNNYKKDFLNQLAFANTDMDEEQVIRSLKAIEKAIGRIPSDKENGIVKIDIDLIMWNNKKKKKDEWDRDYISLLLPSLEQLLDASSHDQK